MSSACFLCAGFRALPVLLGGEAGVKRRWVNIHQQIDMDMLCGTNEAYEAFVDKFKPKLTTDDCYTPENIYNAVRDWVFARYGLPEDTQVVRPFWPGADYQREEYPEGCVVIDNPPFSILAEIEQWYLKKQISFFLFAPSLTLFKPYDGLNYVLANAEITYHNGAVVTTAFVTNMGENLIESTPDLCQTIKRIDEQNQKSGKPELPKYDYPGEVLIASMINKFAKYGVRFAVKREDACFVRALDAQKAKNKTIFGSGFLISEKAAAKKAEAEKAVLEKAKAIIWELSEREKEIVKCLG